MFVEGKNERGLPLLLFRELMGRGLGGHMRKRKAKRGEEYK